jgi:hypothetical protein
MSIDFIIKDVIHQVAVKFVPTFLPEAKKPYWLKAVHQPELDIHSIASKADVYNIATSPKVIEEGLSAGMQLIHYLVADGYRIKTPLFSLRMRVPGTYDGTETALPNGVYPEARMRVSPRLREYLKQNVTVEFDGMDHAEGRIARAVDESTGITNKTVTMGSILTIHGSGLKIESDADGAAGAGVFFKPSASVPIKAELLAVNEPKTIKALVPTTLTEGAAYQLAIFTQSSARHGGICLKAMRDMRSDFTLVAQK